MERRENAPEEAVTFRVRRDDDGGGGGNGSRVGEFLYAEEEGEVEIRTWDARNERFYSSSSERRNGDQHLTAKEEKEEKEKEKEQKRD
jgi:hypothetical protein